MSSPPCHCPPPADSRSPRSRSRLHGLFLLVVAALALGSLLAPTPVAAQDPSSAEVAPGVRDSVVRLYRAVFLREPDAAGLEYWVALYVDGTPLPRIADEFMVSSEWTATYGTLADPDFVRVIYGNVLGREPDPDGFAYWVELVTNGLARNGLLLGFSESAEFVALTGTASPVPPPPPPGPTFDRPPANSGYGHRVVYSNSQQRIWWVDRDDRVVNSYLVSGRRDTPAPGRYQVYSKSLVAFAGHDGITMRHMVRFAHGTRLSIGFHSIPNYANGVPMQSEAQLGTFQSSGCVRQRNDQAAALYQWAPIGLTVVVTP